MANIQKISCNSMKKDAQELEGVLKNIRQIIEQLQVSMRRLSYCWDGPAWSAFQLQINNDIQEMKDLYQNFVKLQKALGEGSNIYLKTEFNVYKDIKSIWI